MKNLYLFQLSAALLALPLSAALWAQPIYKCVDARGVTTISNVRSAGNCQVIATPAEPRSGTVREMRGTAASPAPAATTTSSPSTFPRVSNETQKSRDVDRRMILEQELAAEQRSLEQARKDAGGRDKAAQHERNIQAIQKELSGMR